MKLHTPVLLNETLKFLNPENGNCFLDGTLGTGGHATEIIKKITSQGFFLGLDRDSSQINLCKKKIEEIAFQYQINVILACSSYSVFPHILKKNNIRNLSGIFLDLGFSSVHVDSSERGFSFQNDGPLDMRYDTRNGITAADVINSFGEDALTEIIRVYGEEPQARKIAQAVVSFRSKKRFFTTKELSELIESVLGKKKFGYIHPATKTFQAIRIYVNDEIANLKNFLNIFSSYIQSDGRVVIISFHSIEDSLVKNTFRELARAGKGILLTKKPISASREEIKNNPRARSAKLRAIKIL